MPRRLRRMTTLRRHPLQGWLGLVVFVVGCVLLPVAHSVNHRHDHRHDAPRSAALSLTALTAWLFSEATHTLPRLDHRAERPAEPSPAELLDLATRDLGKLPEQDTPSHPHDDEDDDPLDHGAHSILHLSAALDIHHVFTFDLPEPLRVLPGEPEDLTAQLHSLDTLDLTQARAPPARDTSDARI